MGVQANFLGSGVIPPNSPPPSPHPLTRGTLLILVGEIKKQRDLEYLKRIFVKRLIQRIPLNHYVCFNLNDLTILEHSNHVQRRWKGDFFKPKIT